MPNSVAEGKQYVVDYFADSRLQRVLDVGPGSGTWRDALGPAHPDAHWTGVEVWGPYVEAYNLAARYDRIIVADARYLDWGRVGSFDLAILGDVLEHMPPEDAADLLATVLDRSAFAVVSVPIIHYPQGAEMGNPYETHVAHYAPDTIKSLLLTAGRIVGESVGAIVGAYILRGH